jgi:hypothetical protein
MAQELLPEEIVSVARDVYKIRVVDKLVGMCGCCLLDWHCLRY